MGQELQNTDSIKEAIVQAVAFFDQFDYPLTSWELWRAIKIKTSLAEVLAVLEIGIDNLEQQKGFYFLPGREKTVVARLQRHNYALVKIKKAQRICKIFRWLPWIKLAAVANMIGANNLKQGSDIDLFVVTENKKLWLTRFFTAGLSAILHQRPNIKNSQDKICLSFFVTEGGNDLRQFMLQDERGNIQDDYFVYWLVGLAPVYQKEGYEYQDFLTVNAFIKDILPQFNANLLPEHLTLRGLANNYYYELVDLFWGWLEPQAKKLQLRLFPQQIKELMNKDSRVVVDDEVLKLHVNDRRKQYNKM